MTFPCLFPDGVGDLNNSKVLIKVDYDEYFKHLMRFHDNRFA